MNKIVTRSFEPNVVSSTPSVPADWAAGRFPASDPAIASGNMIGMNRASSMTMPVATFHGGVLSPRPSKPEPLFALAELKS